MPINNAYNIDSIINNMKEYTEITKRRVTFEYILLDGINDSRENAIELAGLLKNILCYVNLIPYNKVVGSEFSRSKKIKDFYDILRENNITATIRQEKGTSIDGACGQLRAKLER
jgi:23S rRNA (adenine2503-C2)-methyltransferase